MNIGSEDYGLKNFTRFAEIQMSRNFLTPSRFNPCMSSFFTFNPYQICNISSYRVTTTPPGYRTVLSSRLCSTPPPSPPYIRVTLMCVWRIDYMHETQSKHVFKNFTANLEWTLQNYEKIVSRFVSLQVLYNNDNNTYLYSAFLWNNSKSCVTHI